MTKKVVTEDQYLEELNRRLKMDEMYEPGMEFIPHPPGAIGSQMSGYSSKIGEYGRISFEVSQEFEIKV
jgi:hypothetical protein